MRKGRAGAMGKDYSRTGKASQVSSFAWMVIGLIAKWKLWSDDGGGAQRGARSLASEMHSSASLAACTPRKCIANQKSGQADYRVETYTIVIRPNLRSDISFRFFHSCNRKCPLFGCSSCAARPICMLRPMHGHALAARRLSVSRNLRGTGRAGRISLHTHTGVSRGRSGVQEVLRGPCRVIGRISQPVWCCGGEVIPAIEIFATICVSARLGRGMWVCALLGTAESCQIDQSLFMLIHQK
jgi:hypothetical protein